MEHSPVIVTWAPTIAMALGFALSWYFYIAAPALPAKLAKLPVIHDIYLFLLNKWYFDQLYHHIFVVPVRWLAHTLWKKGDVAIIDGLGPDGLSRAVQSITRDAVKLQSGYVYQYAFVMLIGVTLIATMFALPPDFQRYVHDTLALWFKKGA